VFRRNGSVGPQPVITANIRANPPTVKTEEGDRCIRRAVAGPIPRL
jgi:hypothetical protein